MSNIKRELQNVNAIEEEIKQFVGRGNNKYLCKWKEIEQTNKIFTINLAAIIFFMYWYMYRKMYKEAISILVVVYVLEFTYFFVSGQSMNGGLYFIIYIIMGLLGNYLYRIHTIEEIRKINNSAENEEEKIAMLKKQGGTSWLMVLLLVTIVFILEYLYLFIPGF
jgi:hypothetical protein